MQKDPKLQNPNTLSIEPYNQEKLEIRFSDKFAYFERRVTKLFTSLKDLKEHNEMIADTFITDFIKWLDDDFQSISNTFEYPLSELPALMNLP
jgi:hypothetical protein